MKGFYTLTLMVVLFSCNTSVDQQENKKDNPLVGTWKFVADQLLDSNYNVVAQDTSVKGFLIYTPDGKMSVQFMWKGLRQSLIGNDTIMKNYGVSGGLGLGSNTWTIEQSRKIIDTYDAYFGDYSIDWENNIVIHTITGNLRPEKYGTAYKRVFRIKGDSLFLRSTKATEKWEVVCIRDK